MNYSVKRAGRDNIRAKGNTIKDVAEVWAKVVEETQRKAAVPVEQKQVLKTFGNVLRAYIGNRS